VVGLSSFGPAMLCLGIVFTVYGRFPGIRGGGLEPPSLR
jgi:hypothetical protein